LLLEGFGGRGFEGLFKDERDVGILLDCVASWQFTLVSDVVQRNMISSPNLHTFWRGEYIKIQYIKYELIKECKI
jgi:hypothetical protein